MSPQLASGPLLPGKSMRPIVTVTRYCSTHHNRRPWGWYWVRRRHQMLSPSFSTHPNGGGAPRCAMGTSRTFSLRVGSVSPAINSECSIFLYGVPGVSIFLNVSATHSGILRMALIYTQTPTMYLYQLCRLNIPMRSHVFTRERLDDVWLSKTFQLNPPIMSQVVQDGVTQLGIVGERSAYKNDVGVRIFEN